MAEGLAAVGLAGNIIQFISFSSALLSKTRDIHQSASGISSDLLDLDTVSVSIKNLTESLLIQSNVSPQLRQIAERCNDVAGELLDIIGNLQHHNVTKGLTKGQSFRKALKCIWKKEQIDALKLRLQLLRDQISLHLVSETHESQAHVVHLIEISQKHITQATDTMTNKISDLDKQLHDIQRNTAPTFIDKGWPTTDTITNGISDLRKRTRDNQWTTARTTNDRDWTTIETMTRINDLDKRLHDIQRNTIRTFNDKDWTRLHDMCTKVQVDVQLVRYRAIVQSLRFECMEVRKDAITNAHDKTFDWIFASNNGQGASPRSIHGFAQWLRTSSGIYWIAGKPGSGKSTLMKYLFRNVETTRHLQAWAGTARLVQADFYFWKPGRDIQKSLEGLLRTLLYHILSTCPDLVSVLCPDRSNQQHVGFLTATPWTLSELQKAFQIFRSRNDVTAKFYFQVDGLDEYYGDSWDIIHTLQDLAMCPNVKMCLSSRPWNSFQDTFGRSNSYVLRLHERTKRDIKIFACETLTAYAAHSDFEVSLFSDLIEDIAERAQGVFLWVRLVVHSLRDGIVNGDPVSILHERLRAIPTDLEDFFKHILESVEGVYQSRMARTFLAALRTRDPLTALHYYFLDQEDTMLDHQSPLAPWTESKIQEIVQQTHRRLNGRFKGLLEPSSTKAKARNPPVDFLHRTLRDFLKTERMTEWLKMLASTQPNILVSMGRAMMITQCIVYENTPAIPKVAIELAGLAIKETGNSEQCLVVVDLTHDVYQRTRGTWLHDKCGFNCYIVQFAQLVGHVDYLRHCIQQRGMKVDVDSILQHVLCCPLREEETFNLCLPESRSVFGLHDRHNKPLDPTVYDAKYLAHDQSHDMIDTLLDFGADPITLLEAVAKLDTLRKTNLDIVRLFFNRADRLGCSMFEWHRMFSSPETTAGKSSRKILRYLELLLSHKVDPNIASHGSTLFGKFLQTLSQIRSRNTIKNIFAKQHQGEILLAFLRAAADVTQVYKDESDESWFSNFLREFSFSFSDKTTIAEFRLFLEHGLNLNNLLRGNITIWYRLLGVIHQSSQLDYQVDSRHQAIHQIMLLSIQHGADPDAPGLPRIIQWMKGKSCYLTAKQVAEIEKALPLSTLDETDANAVGRKRKGNDGRVSNRKSRAKKCRR